MESEHVHGAMLSAWPNPDEAAREGIMRAFIRGRFDAYPAAMREISEAANVKLMFGENDGPPSSAALIIAALAPMWTEREKQLANIVHARPLVRRFAEAIEVELAENDGKPDWHGQGFDELICHLREEVEELAKVVKMYVQPFDFDTAEAEIRRQAISEAADVAAIAMMVADKIAKLSKNRGRDVR